MSQLIHEKPLRTAVTELTQELLKKSVRIQQLEAVLQSIIDGAVHPDIAVRRMCIDLAPIRKVLKRDS